MHVQRIDQIQITAPTLISIGVYDGVHRGHQTLIRQLVNRAQMNGYETVVITFFPHPDAVIRAQTGRYYLTSPEQRAELLRGMGIDWVITQTFDDALRHMRADDYVRLMTQHLNPRELWVGQDFALGYQREGDVDFLTEAGKVHGFAVHPVQLVADEDGHVITSTAIRELLAQGEVAEVKSMLGRCYTLTGKVMHGDKRGRTIGFPTANIGVWEEQLVPRYGVYAGWLTVDGVRHMSVTNIGVRPTFDGQQLTVEAHILNFDADIYDQPVQLELEAFIRPERKFNGLDDLKSRLNQDVQAARELLTALIQA